MFYDRYAQLCEAKGVTASAAARAAGLSKSIVSKWKANKVETPSPDVLKKLASYFGVSVGFLLEEDETDIFDADKKEKPDTQSVELNPNYYNLSPENKALIDEMIAKLVQSQGAE